MENREATVFFAETASEGQGALLDSVRTLGGRHLKTIGSNTYLCLFDDPQAACNAALKLMRAQPPLSFRAGIAKGTVTVTGEDAFGEVVNLAARLQGIARPQEVYFAQEILEGIDRARIPFKEVGPRQFKGISGTVHVYALLKEHEKAAPKTEKPAPKSTHDLFDFSRVDQERIAEEEALRDRLPEKVSEDQIPLASESEAAAPRTPKPKAPTAHINPEILLEARKKAQRKKMFTLWVVFAVVIPVAALAALFAFHTWKAHPTPAQPSLEAKAQGSEVLSSLNEAKARKNIPTQGSILIDTDPPGALVLFNDRLLAGQTPMRLKNVPVHTPIQVKVSKFGFRETVQLLNILPGEERELKIKLQKKP